MRLLQGSQPGSGVCGPMPCRQFRESVKSQALRSPDGMYRTTPLKGLWSHQKGGFYHDGRFATLLDVVNHYNSFFVLGLSDQEKGDLAEYLKSI